MPAGSHGARTVARVGHDCAVGARRLWSRQRHPDAVPNWLRAEPVGLGSARIASRSSARASRRRSRRPWRPCSAPGRPLRSGRAQRASRVAGSCCRAAGTAPKACSRRLRRARPRAHRRPASARRRRRCRRRRGRAWATRRRCRRRVAARRSAVDAPSACDGAGDQRSRASVAPRSRAMPPRPSRRWRRWHWGPSHRSRRSRSSVIGAVDATSVGAAESRVDADVVAAAPLLESESDAHAAADSAQIAVATTSALTPGGDQLDRGRRRARGTPQLVAGGDATPSAAAIVSTACPAPRRDVPRWEEPE
jgi:hypothetical protein